MIQTTLKQRASVLKALRLPTRIFSEKVWTYLVASILDDPSLDQNRLLSVLCGEGVTQPDPRLEPWFEGQPLSPRLGVPGLDHESNSKIDLALGAVTRRGDSENGIAYNDGCGLKWANFVEGKLFDDSAFRTTNDPYRNQLERDIESLLCFQANRKFPEKLYFTILTPRKFKDKPRSRLYGYRILEYQADRSLIACDLGDFKLAPRTNMGQAYPSIPERLEKLKIHWANYEEIFELAYGLRKLDLLDRGGVGAMEVELDRLAAKVEAELRAAVASDVPDGP